ncbi:MAG: 5'/3'-nucleotidase SurE [Fimbriimonadaceae bacterium]|nr:5'/3'-nucleotidase SurE [Alphaproteobacteria bacterium]
MRILLTNDDGIHAPGLKSLEKIARDLSDDVWVVAPETDQSGASHSLTLNVPLRIREISERHFAVQGTPTDCVIMGVRHIISGIKPDLILSGINRGQNLADDVTYSGTVAGAIEGATLGIRSIAFSQSYGFQKDRKLRWQTGEQLGPEVVRMLLDFDFPTSTLFNVNFPDTEPDKVAGNAITIQGRRDQDMLRVDERLDGRGNPYFWYGFNRTPSSPDKGTDLWAIYNNYTSITPLVLGLTDMTMVEKLDTFLNNKR